MPKPKKGPRLGSGPAHQRLMLNGIAAQLFVHEHINTTEAKAKAVRPVAEKLITFAKKGDVAARREVLKQIPDRDIVHKLFSEIGPRFAERNGGYTRILKLGQRQGDGAPMARIELVGSEYPVHTSVSAGADGDLLPHPASAQNIPPIKSNEEILIDATRPCYTVYWG